MCILLIIACHFAFRHCFVYLFLLFTVSGYLFGIVSSRVMVFNATFNNISVILWWSVLVVEATGVPEKNNVMSITLSMKEIQTHNVSGDRN